MKIAVRATAYASVFSGVVFVGLPLAVLVKSDALSIPAVGDWRIVGVVVAVVGAALAIWCITSFVGQGQGTPAPFDAPRLLVVRGPYRFVRNPMYVGGGIFLAGAAIFFGSLPLVSYGGVMWLASHLFVVCHEEPSLRRKHGAAYEEYCEQVGRWWPRPTRDR